MPGTPANRDDSGIDKLQTEKLKESYCQETHHHQDNPPYDPPQAVRELTQTDKLNKQLLESVLERMSKSGEFDKFVDKEELDQGDCDKDF